MKLSQVASAVSLELLRTLPFSPQNPVCLYPFWVTSVHPSGPNYRGYTKIRKMPIAASTKYPHEAHLQGIHHQQLIFFNAEAGWLIENVKVFIT